MNASDWLERHKSSVLAYAIEVLVVLLTLGALINLGMRG